METVKLSGRIVVPITTLQGQRDYYDHLNYWRSCVVNKNLRHSPTRENAQEYLRLKEDKHPVRTVGDILVQRRERMLSVYENRYDWRPKKSGEDRFVGLVSPTGEQLLPDIFADVFTQFDAIDNRPDFVPVFDGDAWALVTLSLSPILVTDFGYSAIIPERWEQRIYFVQDKETKKWGAFKRISPSVNNNRPFKFTLPYVYQLMPCIADEIYEDQLMTDCEPTLFFMTRVGDKVGILTDFGYTPIVYDRYEADDTNCKFKLIRDDRKRPRRVDWWNPDGKRY